ncbi:peptide chain release factor N(5)-glutamine methyltransferase [Streptococcus merionis]|uniref:Release factor glutamine methyltransferase n=1 Tax=Streptococcus merionis TaxID=400065 RepID=A0A239SRP2_9STRE|nr:peptide chain release factor N(5)-glutamine methyltransferase [Streptococcus merionis]SNU87394.1 HemK protein [Streptococcus merionis]
MTYGQLFAQLEQELVTCGEEREALKIVFRELKGWSLTDLVLSLRDEVSAQDSKLIDTIFHQLKNHRPAQYILGYAPFAGMELKVDERVLIPRPETEELVELILAENSQKTLKVLDLCTGSGAIALALKKGSPEWSVLASDISEKALEVAIENANVQNLSVRFMLSDLFDAISGKFDIIVSNPPYIAYEDREEVGVNVLASEPHLALFAKEDGLAIYRQIIDKASAHLTRNGKLYFEIGYKQGKAVSHLLTEHFPKSRVRILQDQFGKDRMVVMDRG